MDLDFKHLLDDSQHRLFSFIRSKVSNYHDSQDLLQSVNLILVSKQELFDPKKGSFINWAIVLCNYQIMAYFKSLKRNKIDYLQPDHLDSIDHRANSDFAYEQKIMVIKKNALNNSIDNLPEHMKEIAFLRFKKDLPFKDISAKVNRSHGGVAATLSRIKDKLKTSVPKEYDNLLLISDV